MTEMLYMPDIESNYIKEFKATVIAHGDDYVVLDFSAFYPLGGGQPSDAGYLSWPGGRRRVKEVKRKDGELRHFLDMSEDGPLPEGEVTAVLDWDRRYGHMRMHTSQHIVSGVVYDMFKARTVGNQLYADRARIDFRPLKIDDDGLRAIEKRCDEEIAKGLSVKIYEEARDSLEQRVDPERCNLDLLPASVRNLRIVDTEGVDVCPCAGTHVKNTSELGKIVIYKKENKGSGTVRLTYRLEPF